MSAFEIIDNDMTEMSEAEEIQYLNLLLKKSKDGEIVWDEIIYDNYLKAYRSASAANLSPLIVCRDLL